MVHSSRILTIALFFLPLGIIAGYSIDNASANKSGVGGVSISGCSGGGCHGSKSTATVVHLYTDSSTIIAGQTYVFHFSVSNPSEKGAGCDISVDKAAKLAVNGSGSGLQYYSNELTHTYGGKAFTGDSAVWSFKYTAPKAVGTAHIYAAGNAVNMNGTNDASDHWNTTSSVVTVAASGVEPASTNANSVSISPNPSRGNVTIYSDLSGPATIEVSDANGRTVYKELVAMGAETPLDLSFLPHGQYFLTVQPREGQGFTKRFVIQ